MGRREFPVRRAHLQADAVVPYGDYNWTFCCFFYGNTHAKKYHGSSAITISAIGTFLTCRRTPRMSANRGGPEVIGTRSSDAIDPPRTKTVGEANERLPVG
jgi:hypothetical protein